MSETIERPRVLVLRAHEDASELMAALHREGLEGISLPLIAHRDLVGDDALRATLALAEECWVVVTSPPGARRLARLAPLFPWLRIASVGPATSRVLHAAGIAVDLEGDGGGAKGLVAAFERRESAADEVGNVVWISSDRALPVLPQGLERLGQKVIAVAAYETILERPDPERVAAALAVARAACFTSPSTVEAFQGAVAPAADASLLRDLVAAALGETTATALKSAGFTRIVEAEETTMDALARAVAASLEFRR